MASEEPRLLNAAEVSERLGSAAARRSRSSRSSTQRCGRADARRWPAA